MYAVRLWSVRHAGALERLYNAVAGAAARLGPLLDRIGHARLEAPVAAVERRVKGLLFDCRMCGACVLASTGMSCPMNCPKSLRNGPCGGVRSDGMCEVEPAMRCVWVEAWEGAGRMRDPTAIRAVEVPLDHRAWGSSAWLRAARERAAAPPADGGPG
jgi:hypothetical protein